MTSPINPTESGPDRSESTEISVAEAETRFETTMMSLRSGLDFAAKGPHNQKDLDGLWENVLAANQRRAEAYKSLANAEYQEPPTN